MTAAEPTTTNVTASAGNNNNNNNSGSRRGIALFFLLLISLLTLLRASSTTSKFYHENTSSSSSVIALETNYSTSITAVAETSKTASAAAAAVGTTYHHQTSDSLPIYLIDTNINRTNVAVSTWGNIAPHWNRTTVYSNPMNLVTTTTVSSLPFDNNKQRQIKVVIHCGPKVASTTLRVAYNIQQTCPQLNLTSISHEPPGYTGGNRLVSIMKECVDTYYFCVNQITVLDMLSTTTTITTTDESTATNETNIQYIHLFSFRNYNDWVKSAIKQQYDRSGQKGCRAAQRKWEDGKCQHLKLLEPDIRKYGRVDLERFLGGVVRLNSDNNSSNNVDDEQLEERRGGGGVEHTFLLYPHTHLHEVMKVVSTTYHIPMLPGTTIYQKGGRPEGTCNESLVELYHECFSDELMEFQWDSRENQVHK